uniref:RNA polymerase I subunit G n=1 Tax=Hucho hucho TaxID=62062 RepID=A0A4W5NTU4_9TELE
MPKDVSSSSDGASDTEEVPQKRGKQASRYQCPADFVAFAHKPCASTLIERLRDDNAELWLIKAPSGFNPDSTLSSLSHPSFSSLKMPLSGLQTMQAPAQKARGGDAGQIYSVLGGPSGAVDLRLLTSHHQRLDSVVCAPAFSGLLNICESYGDCSTNQTAIAIPATPAPTVPPGLRQRFQPFGSRTPTLSRLMEDTPLPSSPETPLRVTLDPGEERKKKKKRKDKRIKIEEEEEEVVRVKQELLDMSPEESYELPGQKAELSEEKRRKKKKKKDKDRGEAEGTVDSCFNVIKQEVEVKVEPMDSSYGDVEDSGKKKKMKKN